MSGLVIQEDDAEAAMKWVQTAYNVFRHNPDGQNFTRWNMQTAYCAGLEAARSEARRCLEAALAVREGEDG